MDDSNRENEVRRCWRTILVIISRESDDSEDAPGPEDDENGDERGDEASFIAISSAMVMKVKVCSNGADDR